MIILIKQIWSGNIIDFLILYSVLSLQILLNFVSGSFNVDVLAIFIIYYALKKGMFKTLWMGALAGLIFDIHSQTLFGVNMFSYSLLGAVSGFFHEKKWFLSYKIKIAVSFLATFILYISKSIMVFIVSKLTFSIPQFFTIFYDSIGVIVLTFFVSTLVLFLTDEST